MGRVDGTNVDVAVIGGGLAGFGTAALLQRAELSTAVLEAHRQPGGCAGFWRTRGFSFDVGATTFVDFDEGGVGGQFLTRLGIDVPGELLPGYRVVLPDRTVTLWRDRRAWQAERLRAFGDSAGHRSFWALIDRLNHAFWAVTRAGRVTLPLRPRALVEALRAVCPGDWGLARYLRWTMADALDANGVGGDRALRTTLGMLLEDTVHSTVEQAPLINGAMGVNIRGAGLTRFVGGARGLWRALIRRYRQLGGRLFVNAAVHRVERRDGFVLTTSQGTCRARRVVSAIPIARTAALAPFTADVLRPYVRRDHAHRGGAILVMLGVPETELGDTELTHHGLFHDYDAPFGNGNNMFVSVSSPGDTDSAPAGHRAVMISTHCELEPWKDAGGYPQRKRAVAERLVRLARRVHPRLGTAPVVLECGTPRTYARFTGRPDGAVGGVRQTLGNTNQRAVPHDIGIDGFHVVGDTTWPGLGTVSCLVGARAVADAILG